MPLCYAPLSPDHYEYYFNCVAFSELVSALPYPGLLASPVVTCFIQWYSNSSCLTSVGSGKYCRRFESLLRLGSAVVLCEYSVCVCVFFFLLRYGERFLMINKRILESSPSVEPAVVDFLVVDAFASILFIRVGYCNANPYVALPGYSYYCRDFFFPLGGIMIAAIG